MLWRFLFLPHVVFVRLRKGPCMHGLWRLRSLTCQEVNIHGLISHSRRTLPFTVTTPSSRDTGAVSSCSRSRLQSPAFRCESSTLAVGFAVHDRSFELQVRDLSSTCLRRRHFLHKLLHNAKDSLPSSSPLFAFCDCSGSWRDTPTSGPRESRTRDLSTTRFLQTFFRHSSDDTLPSQRCCCMEL
jgi:hypothetical protein